LKTKATSDGLAWRSEPGPWGRGDLVAVLVWTAAIVAFFWDAVSCRGALFYFDITEINFPYRDFLAREIRLGRFARWHPGLYCGLPLFSESQAGYLHPLKYVFYTWLPSWKAFNLDTVASVWLTGLATFGWLRRHVGPRGALTGAAVFALGGFEWAHLIHTSMANALTSVPLVVWALEWAWDRGRKAGVVLGAAALACQVFAGHLQDTLFTIGLVGLYAAFRAATEPPRRSRLAVLGTAGALVGLGVALAAVQWVPSKELLDRSPRAGGLSWEKLTYGSWHPELLPTLVVREAYGTRARDTDWMDGFYPYHEMNVYLGLTAVALAAVGAGASRNRWVAFWVVLVVVGGLLMLGRFTFLFDVAHRIPVAGSSRIPVRFHLWVSLAAAALAGVGVDRLERGFDVRLRVPGLLAAALVVGSVPILIAVYQPAVTNPARWNTPYHVARYQWLARELTTATVRTALVGGLGAAAAVAAARTTSPRVRAASCAGLPLVVMADLFGAQWYEVPTVPPRYWTQPPLSARKLKADPALSRVFGVATLSAGEPGYASEPVDYFAARDTLSWSLPPVWGLATSGGQTPVIPRRMVEYTDSVALGRGRFDVESVSHLLGGRMDPKLGPTVPAGAALIWKNPNVLPRARLMGRPFYAAGEAAAVDALTRLGAEIRDRVVVEDPDRPLPPDAPAAGTARIVVDEPEHVAVETESSGSAYLALADTYDPGWAATVDGRPAPIRPAWVAFRAVFLTPGRHRVDFRYTPAGFYAGLTVSLAGVVAAAVLLLWPGRLPTNRPAHDELGWPRRWPLGLLIAAAAVIAVSAVGLGPDGRPAVSTRWANSFHTFTWGAGYEAMRFLPKD
jgi:hypothetical protein